MPSATPVATLEITQEEQAELTRILTHALEEIRVEVHRTHTPSTRDIVQQEEAIIRGLLHKLKKKV